MVCLMSIVNVFECSGEDMSASGFNSKIDYGDESNLVPMVEVRELCYKVLGGLEIPNHVSQLKMEYDRIDRGDVVMKMPFQESLIGNPINGVMHGGAITTLLDTCCGAAALSVLTDLSFAPTLDLRVDYLSRGDNQSEIWAQAEIYRLTDSIIFARGIAYQHREKPVAQVHANFARLSPKHTAVMKESIYAILGRE